MLGAGNVLADLVVGDDLRAALTQEERGEVAGGGAPTLPHGAET